MTDCDVPSNVQDGWSNLPQCLAANLDGEPCISAWRAERAPRLSFGRHDGPAVYGARNAAVAIVLCRDGDDWTIPLTLRQSQLRRHGGQVSFPGGLLEPGEDAWQGARRELEEELGCLGPLEQIGLLGSLWVFASNTIVTPCIFAIESVPEWNVQVDEVAAVLALSCRRLVRDDVWEQMTVVRSPWSIRAPCLQVEGVSVWGATAVMLGELQGRVVRAIAEGAA